MRITYRERNVKEYWASRWEGIPADTPMTNVDVYPLKFSEITIKDKDGKILEAGCGAGRLLRYYHERDYDITGFDYIENAIRKLKKADQTLSVEVCDITNLPYPDETFKYILAFGLYHNLENGLDNAIIETYRVLAFGGSVCASIRADNLQTRLTDWLTRKRSKSNHKSEKSLLFHKINLTKTECVALFERAGFIVQSVYSVENMPLLYKFRIFRARTHKDFNENQARAEGYQLSFIGVLIQRLIMKLFPEQFCNLYVLIASKHNDYK